MGSPGEPYSYEFEGIDAELSRPPLAAVRCLRMAGVKPNDRLWKPLPLAVRRALAVEGAREEPSPEVIEALFRQLPLKAVELVPHRPGPEPTMGPELASALGVSIDWIQSLWPRLRALDRFVLAHLRGNTRLLWRAMSEIEARLGHVRLRRSNWKGQIARAEVVIGAPTPVREELMVLLAREAIAAGRGLLLARASGVRAARAADFLFDLHAGEECGVLELDWAVLPIEGSVLWQSHASTIDGSFHPVAALAAVANAAICVLDLIKEFDPDARLSSARLADEHWIVGKYDQEEPTLYLDRGPRP